MRTVWRCLSCNINYVWRFCNFRPQRSWGKVIFSQASVILLTGGWCASCWGGASSQGGLPLGGGSSWEDASSWGGGCFLQGGLLPLGGASSGVLLPRGCFLQGGLVETPHGQLLLRAVCILLEYILFAIVFTICTPSQPAIHTSE